MYGTLAFGALLGMSSAISLNPRNYKSNSTGEKVFDFPLNNNFPNVSSGSQALSDIQAQAHGSLPNNPNPPPKPQPDSLTSLGFIAFNELFEVAFFKELIYNITTYVDGYKDQDIPNRDKVLENLKIIQAQEELHEINANGAFTKFTGETIQPCEYVFPVSNFSDAIGLASTFTDVVLGTLPDILTIFANDNDNLLIRGVGSVIGQEGEQNGYFRELLGKNPSALPFLTAGARDFAFSAINQNFVVPDSCPSLHLLEPTLKIFGLLNVLTPPTEPKNQDVKFSYQTKTSSVNTQSFVKQTGMYLTYINQQNVPFSVEIEDQKFTGDAVEFTAYFPGGDLLMNGLTIAAVTQGSNFSSVDDVADNTLFGPGLIEIN